MTDIADHEHGDATPADDLEASDAAGPIDTPDASATVEAGGEAGPGDTADEVDLDVIEADFAGVEAALGRLAEGTYWTDEVTGEAILDDVLDADPTARRAH